MHKLELVCGAIDYIEAHLGEKITLEKVAAALHYSKYHLHRSFTQTVGMTIHRYAGRRQLTEAAKLLAFTDWPILDIALLCGYESQQAFTAVFREMYKQTPGALRCAGSFYPLQLRFVLDGMRKKIPCSPTAQIRLATAGDIPGWLELAKLAIDGFPHLVESEFLAALRRAIDRQQAVVAVEDGQIIGAMILCRATGSIDFLGVHPLYRRSAVPKRLLDCAVRELIHHGSITTTTYRAGDRADTGHREALLKLGFAEAELLREYGYPTQRLVLDTPPPEEEND